MVHRQRPTVNTLGVLLQIGELDHAHVAQEAPVRSNVVVHVHMVLELVWAEKLLSTSVTLAYLAACVVRHYPVDGEHVVAHAPPFGDDFPAEVTLVFLTAR